MRCTKCGCENSDAAKFCRSCGIKLMVKRKIKKRKYVILSLLVIIAVTTSAAATMHFVKREDKPAEVPKATEGYQSFFNDKFKEIEEYDGNFFRALVRDLNGDGTKECIVQWEINGYDAGIYTYSEAQEAIVALPENGFELKSIELRRISGTDEFNLIARGDTTGTEDNIMANRFKITSDGFASQVEQNGLLLDQEDSHEINGKPVNYDTFMESYDTYFNDSNVQSENNLWEELEQFETLDALADYISSSLGINVNAD